MPVRPLRPVQAVSRVTHLPLVEVELRDPGHPIGIQYLFGHIARGERGLADLASHASRYVIVGEVIGLSQLVRPMLFRHRSPTGKTLYVEWHANLHCHNLSLSVVSNVKSLMVKRLGKTLLTSEKCAN